MTNEMKKLALVAGFGYLVIFVSGIYANFTVIEPLKGVMQDTSFLSLIKAELGNLRQAIMAFVLMILADLLLTWALYEWFKAKFPKLSLLAAWLRLVNVAVFAVALNELFQVLWLVDHPTMANEIKQFSIEQAMHAFDSIWLCGLLFFGAHLILLGKMLWEGKKFMRVIGLLLYIAGFGYLLDTTAHILLPNYSDYADFFAMTVIIPGVVGELSLTIWLFVKGLQTSKH